MPIGNLPVQETPDMGITLSDGTRLSARVWKPEGAGSAPVPAILEFLPYRKRDGTVARDALTHPYFASYGYACPDHHTPRCPAPRHGRLGHP